LYNYQNKLNKLIETLINYTEDETGKTEINKLSFIT